MCDSIVINGGNVSIQISGGGPGVTEIQNGLATALAGREQAISVNAPNHIAVTVDLSSATWNTLATHEVFTVTGAVRMRLWVECTESLTGLGGLVIGNELDTTVLIGSGVEPPIPLQGKLYDMVNSNISAWASSSNIVVDKVSYGLDIGYEVMSDPATDGTLIFHCVWEPLSAGATVVAGAGGPL